MAVGRLAQRQRLLELAPGRLDHPGAGDQVPGTHAVLVEEDEQHEQHEPRKRSPVGRAPVRAGGREKGQRQEDFDIAQEVAGDHCLGGQPPAVARGDADAGGALAGRRAARAELEIEEIAVAEQEQRRDPHYREQFETGRKIVAVPAADHPRDHQDRDERDDQLEKADQHQVEDQRARACAAAAEGERQDEAFGRGQHPPARLGRIAGEGSAHGRSPSRPRRKAKK